MNLFGKQVIKSKSVTQGLIKGYSEGTRATAGHYLSLGQRIYPNKKHTQENTAQQMHANSFIKSSFGEHRSSLSEASLFRDKWDVVKPNE